MLGRIILLVFAIVLSVAAAPVAVPVPGDVSPSDPAKRGKRNSNGVQTFGRAVKFGGGGTSFRRGVEVPEQLADRAAEPVAEAISDDMNLFARVGHVIEVAKRGLRFGSGKPPGVTKRGLRFGSGKPPGVTKRGLKFGSGKPPGVTKRGLRFGSGKPPGVTKKGLRFGSGKPPGVTKRGLRFGSGKPPGVTR